MAWLAVAVSGVGVAAAVVSFASMAARVWVGRGASPVEVEED